MRNTDVLRAMIETAADAAVARTVVLLDARLMWIELRYRTMESVLADEWDVSLDDVRQWVDDQIRVAMH